MTNVRRLTEFETDWYKALKDGKPVAITVRGQQFSGYVRSIDVEHKQPGISGMSSLNVTLSALSAVDDTQAKQAEHPVRAQVRRIRDGCWVQLCDGSPFWPLDPLPADVRIEPIAYGLSRLARFCGQTRGEPYSVAQHSVHVSYEVERSYRDRYGETPSPPVGHVGIHEAALNALLHDASEFVLSDIARPIKQQPQLAAYREAEKNLQVAIYEAFGAIGCDLELLHLVDLRMLRTEQRDLMLAEIPNEGRGDAEPYPWHVEPWPWREAERRFLARFAELMPRGIMSLTDGVQA